jgi:hypothetical protein
MTQINNEDNKIENNNENNNEDAKVIVKRPIGRPRKQFEEPLIRRGRGRPKKNFDEPVIRRPTRGRPMIGETPVKLNKEYFAEYYRKHYTYRITCQNCSNPSVLRGKIHRHMRSNQCFFDKNNCVYMKCNETLEEMD